MAPFTTTVSRVEIVACAEYKLALGFNLNLGDFANQLNGHYP